MIFYILSLWGLLLIILSRFSLHETLEIDKRAKNVKYSLLLLKTEIYNRSFMLCSLSLSAIMGGFFSYLAASPFIFQSIYGLTAFEYSLTFAFISVCISATGMLAGRLCRKFSEFKILRIALIVMLVTAFMIMFEALWLPKSFVVVMLTLALFCALMALSQSSGFGIVMGLRRGGAGAASGLFGVLSFLLGSLISPFVGILGEKSMLPLGIIMITCVIMAIVLLKSALKGVNTDKL
jgi:DHA1 family bicyclomycin/chloramphenicol resistance-like MFS transporter